MRNKKFILIITILFTNYAFSSNWKELIIESDADLFDISFPSEQIGYVIGTGATMLKTTDKGETWTQINFGPFHNDSLELTSIHFLNENVGFVSAYYYKSNVPGWGDYPYAYKIFKTSNQGNTWTDISPEHQDYQQIYDIYFSNEDNGMAYTFSGILVTSNGGIQWQKTNDSLCFTTNSYFLNDSTIFSYGTNCTFYYDAIIYKSVNLGHTWETVLGINFDSLGNIIDDNIQFMNSSINSIQFIDNQNGFMHIKDLLSESNGKIFKTNNVGSTWDSMSTSPIDGNDILFSNSNDGLIGGTTGIYATKDGGANWSSSYYNSDIMINKFLKTGASVYAVGTNGTILKSEGEIIFNSIRKDNGLKQLNIYPNPAENYFNINYGNISISQIKIYDIKGREIENIPSDYKTNDLSISCKDYLNGTYIVVLFSEGQLIGQSIVQINKTN